MIPYLPNVTPPPPPNVDNEFDCLEECFCNISRSLSERDEELYDDAE